MRQFTFKNETDQIIDQVNPTLITSIIEANDVVGKIEGIRVKLNVEHSYTSDLRIVLTSPSDTKVTLSSNIGGSGDNFIDTIFDDRADRDIVNSAAPFTGQFRPFEPLSKFIDEDPSGQWVLSIEDQAIQDGGILDNWELMIQTDANEQPLPLIFNNMTTVQISPDSPNIISSNIFIDQQDGLTVEEIAVTLDISHSYTNDLKLSLSHDSGTSVNLVSFVGGSGDNFSRTTFDDKAGADIRSVTAPFTGTFKSEEALSAFSGLALNGTWTLTIEDSARLDGGQLNFWKMCIRTSTIAVPPSSGGYDIQVRFLGGLTNSQEAIFSQAAARWAEVISIGLTPFNVDGEIINNLLIEAEGKTIDGVNGILGQAGPTHIRPDSLLPVKGIMSFDSADLQGMEDSGELLDVIIHEMGHVIGIGTLWSFMELIEASGTDNPLFIGPNAMLEYGILAGLNIATKVPIANTGGPGTREGHWRELTFETELMTGFDNPGKNALSRMTIASLQDLGYQVNINAADVYQLPLRTIRVDELEPKHSCRVEFPEVKILSQSDRIT